MGGVSCEPMPRAKKSRRTKCMLQTATTVKAPADRASNSQLMKPLLLVLFPRMRRVAYEPRTETRIEATVTPGLAVHGT